MGKPPILTGCKAQYQNMIMGSELSERRDMEGEGGDIGGEGG